MSVSRLRVLVLTQMFPNQNDPTNGIFVCRQLEWLVREGVKVIVVCPVPYVPRFILKFSRKTRWKNLASLPERDDFNGLTVYYFRYLSLPLSRFGWFWSILPFSIFACLKSKLRLLVQEFKPNLIHAYNATPMGMAGLLFARRFGLKYICSLRGSDINLYPNRSKFILRQTQKVLSRTDQITAVSRTLREKAMRIDKNRNDIVVIYNGCDQMMFRRTEEGRKVIRARYGISAQAEVIIYVGHFKLAKGIYDLLEVFKRLVDVRNNAFLLVVGDGDERAAFVRRVESDKTVNRVVVVGSHKQENIPAYLSAADLFLFPSHSEGLPNAVLEAMACEVPVVASRVGGIPEAVEHRQNGLLVDVGNIDGFVQAVGEILDSKDLSRGFTKAARRNIKQEFTWQASANTLIEVYRKTVVGQ